MSRSRLVVFAALALWVAGCAEGFPNDPADSGEFSSDLPRGSAAGPGTNDAAGEAASVPSSSAGTKGQSADRASSSSAERAIVEADMIQLAGDRLYALSRVAGLALIDVSDPAQLKLLGRYRDLPATPFEMYLRGDVAVVMFSGWGQYALAEDGSYSWESTSKVVSLDVADPAAIELLGTFDVPGSISDSRIVGDVLYVASFEDGYCWRCEQNKPTTSIVSLDVADPHQMRKVDQLRYGDNNQNYSWQRSITVTEKRMYVAGPEYGQQGPIGSTIQVIDISDPHGDLVEGAVLEASGQIQSRWQMDEYDGVLRVISQSPAWRTTEPPRLQTFKVVSSQDIRPLARLDIVVPNRETLRSARFDGPRGYLITALQQDPLFTLDLSNPAAPKQLGELEMPGFLYHMEPRGDRLLGLGFDQGNKAGAITVSLFDVSDLSAPKMLSRVNFGGDWANLAEDQDRIHKLFRVLPDEGLILVPFSGYEYSSKEEYCGGKSVGGVQLVDYANDSLQLRGAAPGAGQARRALVHREHLLSISDQRVEAFGITDRSKPKAVGQLIMSNTVTYAARLDNEVVARITQPNWDSRFIVELVGKPNAEDMNQRLGELNLDQFFPNTDNCSRWWSLESLHAEGSLLYLLYVGSTANPDKRTSESHAGVLAIDASNPSEPKLAGRAEWSRPEVEGSWNTYYGEWQYGGFASGGPYLWHGSLLAFLEQQDLSRTNQPDTRVRLRVMDLRDPAKMQLSTLDLDGNQIYSGLIADGDRVWTTHFDRPTATSTSARFFADSIDVSNPTAPKRTASINVPGRLVTYDRASGRGVTSQLKRVVVQGVTAEQCYERFAQADFEWPDPRRASSETKGTCNGFKESLHLIGLDERRAVLLDTLALAEDQRVSSWSAGDGLLFTTLSHSGYYSFGPTADVACFDCGRGGSSKVPPVELLVLGLTADQFDIGWLKVETDKQSWWGFWGTPPVYAHGKKALLVGNGDAAIVDASEIGTPRVERTVPLIGYTYSVQVQEGTALLALGEQGIQWIDL
ncbi:MAG TPA: beta-propeller domain-containing protein [Polyangiales bacterium]|nr:beta-propeller domain-containing protein [Polyangiales bacterium]